MSEAFYLHRQRGWEFNNDGKFEEAIAELWAARDLNPDDAWTRRTLGAVLSQIGQKETAIAEYREAIRLEPTDEEVHLHLVYDLMEADRSTEALAAVRDALAACANSAGLYRHFGILLRVEASKTKDRLGWEAAATAFQRAIDLDPTNPSALHSLGMLHWKLGRKHEAVTALKAAVAVDPDNLKALEQLGRYQARRGNFSGVFQTAHAMVRLPETEEKQQYLADAARQQKQALFVGTGLAAVLVGVWIWSRRRGR